MQNLDFRQRLLALITLLGGIMVLASYALVPAYSPEVRAGLWGGVPGSLRPIYTVSMLLAAAGFFPFTYQLIFRRSPEDFADAVGLPYAVLFGAYALVYAPSALWVPLTAATLQSSSAFLWALVRADLALVALGSTLLLVLLVRLAIRRGGSLPLRRPHRPLRRQPGLRGAGGRARQVGPRPHRRRCRRNRLDGVRRPPAVRREDPGAPARAPRLLVRLVLRLPPHPAGALTSARRRRPRAHGRRPGARVVDARPQGFSNCLIASTMRRAPSSLASIVGWRPSPRCS